MTPDLTPVRAAEVEAVRLGDPVTTSPAERGRALVWLRRLAVASVVTNVLIVVTGGVVRLTGSGLGCPTWPRCTEESFTPHGAMDVHAGI